MPIYGHSTSRKNIPSANFLSISFHFLPIPTPYASRTFPRQLAARQYAATGLPGRRERDTSGAEDGTYSSIQPFARRMGRGECSLEHVQVDCVMFCVLSRGCETEINQNLNNQRFITTSLLADRSCQTRRIHLCTRMKDGRTISYGWALPGVKRTIMLLVVRSPCIVVVQCKRARAVPTDDMIISSASVYHTTSSAG
jgi:hypothetical protein